MGIVMKQLVAGILAHVDAGKTTLSEGILYLSGSIRKLGRVDHKDAFLDTDAQERARGITIFSKQANIVWKEMELTLLDTPGHVDFSAEMERALQVLDYAVLVISGTDGVQGHTETLWRLLTRYRVPTFLFVNKMDLSGADRKLRLANLKSRLSDSCIDFSAGEKESFYEELALCSEELLEEYMDQGWICVQKISKAVADQQVFPVFFGSALKLDGVEALLDGMEKYCAEKKYPHEFGARIYKIGRDEQGNRLTWMKLTGGSLRVREAVSFPGNNEENFSEKVDQIRIYNGAKFRAVDCVSAGMVCAVTGLTKTQPGQGIGIEPPAHTPMMAPVMTYRMLLPAGQDASVMLKKMKQLEEEDPLLHIRWNAALQEIHVQIMGEVQTEVLTELIRRRFGVEAGFDMGSIVYRETIAQPVEGMGHYEPLRHYAEVHLFMEPGEPGSGLVFDTAVSEDDLDRNWQRLILAHLEEREHLGVLTGSPITDIKITLVAGRAHIKHTEGGDFRQATYRAVRHGLMRTKSVLLEPYYEFRMELPAESIGRAMSDVERMCGKFDPPNQEGEVMVLTGTAPVSEMQGYAAVLNAYSRGRGHILCTMKGYMPCHNADKVIAEIDYHAETDLDHSADSVFCAHGAGFLVPWQQAADYMHLEALDLSGGNASEKKESNQYIAKETTKNISSNNYSGSYAEDKELEEIFTRTFGEIKRRVPIGANSLGKEKAQKKHTTDPAIKPQEDAQKKSSDIKQECIIENTVTKTIQKSDHIPIEYLLVDGYNVIFSWDELAELAKENLDSARLRLMDILCNYQGFVRCRLILVFDAYRVKGGQEKVQQYHNIDIVYTKEAESADMYIEKVSHKLGRKYRVTVATSDALEQLIVIGQGAVRISSRELKEEVERVTKHKLAEYINSQPKMRNFAIKDALDGAKGTKKNSEVPKSY